MKKFVKIEGKKYKVVDEIIYTEKGTNRKVKDVWLVEFLTREELENKDKNKDIQMDTRRLICTIPNMYRDIDVYSINENCLLKEGSNGLRVEFGLNQEAFVK